MMFALNFTAVRFSLKSSVSHFLIHIKSQWKRGARGEEPCGFGARFLLPVNKKIKG